MDFMPKIKPRWQGPTRHWTGRPGQLDSSEPGSPNGTVGSAAIGTFSVVSFAGNGYLNDGGLRGRNGTAPGWPMTGRGVLSWSLRSTSRWADIHPL
jgi:hypothetical protein